MNGTTKSYTVDKYLHPIRKQICDMVPSGTQILELGCGNGDLLFQLSPKIKKGVGLDISGELIHYARKKANSQLFSNLRFDVKNVSSDDLGSFKYDYVIISLFLHVIPPSEAQFLLHGLHKFADQIIICAFTRPENKWQRFLLWLDQRFTSHFKNFHDYQNQGYMNGLIKDLNLSSIKIYDTFDPVIKVYQLIL